jgi:hypothetical protein
MSYINYRRVVFALRTLLEEQGCDKQFVNEYIREEAEICPVCYDSLPCEKHEDDVGSDSDGDSRAAEDATDATDTIDVADTTENATEVVDETKDIADPEQQVSIAVGYDEFDDEVSLEPFYPKQATGQPDFKRQKTS